MPRNRQDTPKRAKNDSQRQSPKPRKIATKGHQDTGDSKASHLSAHVALPIPLQQLILNIFKTSLFVWPAARSREISSLEDASSQSQSDPTTLLNQQIQTIKSHLYNRDFVSAFADADAHLLRAYALRWSAARALGYAGIFEGVFNNIKSLNSTAINPYSASASSDPGRERVVKKHILCIGGGAGAEVVAIAAALRDMQDGVATLDAQNSTIKNNTEEFSTEIEGDISQLSLSGDKNAESYSDPKPYPLTKPPSGPSICVTALDIAGWAPVIDELSKAITSDSIPSPKPCANAPLLPLRGGDGETASNDPYFTVSFQKKDILSLSEEALSSLLYTHPTSPTKTVLVTLMFTLNELFSTSISQTVSMLLKLTDLLLPGTLLLVVDSPGSYSTVSLTSTSEAPPSSSPSPTGGTANTEHRDVSVEGKRYPMRFLLEHTLLSVAAGSWESVLSDDSRWFRRERDALKYNIGSVALEDMRYQIHVYRRAEA